MTAQVEQPWRQEICLNGSWRFQPVSLPANYDIKNGAPVLAQPTEAGWSATPIRIPSPWNVNSFRGKDRTFPSYPAEWDNVRMGWLRRTFKVPAEWKDQRLILTFEAICGSAQVIVNGQQVAEHFDNSLPFSVDVTDFVERDGDNTLLVGVRQASLFDVPGPFGKHTYPAGSPWTLQMIGIWQDVYLRALPAIRVSDIAVRPLLDQGTLELAVTVRNDTAETKSFKIGGKIQPWINGAGADLLTAPVPRGSLGDPVADVPPVEGSVGPRTTTTVVLRRAIQGELKFWTPETPNLYGLVLDVQEDGKTADRFYQRFGWRQWGITGRDVTLNGKVYQLRADSGHLLGVPYMTRRYAYSWYKAIKDVNGNSIRLHAIIRPRFYTELADEMGIAIMVESDIWASSTDINYFAPETWLRFNEHIDNMVLRDRNHASVFGWSIANEILSAVWWKGVPRRQWPPILDRVVALADRVRALDSTRPWISCDGDGDLHGRLPTYIYHYGKPQDWNRQAPKDKPFGIGEGGSMLWGSPAVFSAENGERSYESRLGMQEGTAIEIYRYLVEQRKICAFCSIFTIAESCFETVPLGAGDASGKPGTDTGITFGPFVEGQPGMQPERMGAYTTNFNPGYDPSQPFYVTTPVFEAVKAAYAPDGPLPCKWDHRPDMPPRPPVPAPTLKQVAFVGDEKGDLKKALESSGIPTAAGAISDLLVIDGATLDESRLPDTRRRMQETLQRKGTVFVWAGPENLQNLNALLPAPITLNPCTAHALIADREAPETAPLALGDLFFEDQSDRTILKQGLSGPLVEMSRILMEASPSSRGRRGGDDRSRGTALIATEAGGGRLIVTSLRPDVRSDRRMKLMRSLYANLGVALGESSRLHDNGFDGAGFLNQVLLIGSFQGFIYPKIMDHDFLGDEARANPVPGTKVGDREWTFTPVLGDGLFDFFRIGIPGTEGNRSRAQGTTLKPEALDANNYLEVIERVSGTNPGTNSVAYLSFWIQSPQAIEASKLNLVMVSDDGTKIWANSKPIFEDRRIYGPGMTDPKRIPLALQEGWNHVLVKVGQLDGPWAFSARFESPDTTFVSRLRASAVRPN